MPVVATMDLPESLKFIKRFLVQATQVERSKHALIAYYLRLYAVTLALKLPKEQLDPAVKQYIVYLMDELEKLKGDLELDQSKDRARVEEFAAQLFDFVDKTDRAGKASKSTALGFLAASVVFECLEYFEPLEPEIHERIRYAKWKAADISTVLKMGEIPTPGPYNSPDSLAPAHQQAQSHLPSLSVEFEQKEVEQTAPVALQSFDVHPAPSLRNASSTRQLSIREEKQYYLMLVDAEKKTTQALASIRFKDWNGAESLLVAALEQVRSIKAMKS